MTETKLISEDNNVRIKFKVEMDLDNINIAKRISEELRGISWDCTDQLADIIDGK